MIITCGSFVVDSANKILLCKATNSYFGWGVPKGLPETNEEYIDAAKRELIEETGINIDSFPHKMQPLGISEYPNKKKSIVGFLFMVNGIINQKLICKSKFFDLAYNMYRPEVDDYMWVDLYKAIDIVGVGQKALILKCFKN